MATPDFGPGAAGGAVVAVGCRRRRRRDALRVVVVAALGATDAVVTGFTVAAVVEVASLLEAVASVVAVVVAVAGLLVVDAATFSALEPPAAGGQRECHREAERAGRPAVRPIGGAAAHIGPLS